MIIKNKIFSITVSETIKNKIELDSLANGRKISSQIKHIIKEHIYDRKLFEKIREKYITSCQPDKKKRPKHNLSSYIPHDINIKLKEISSKQSKSKSQIVREILCLHYNFDITESHIN